MGFGRSGTTVLQHLISSHPDLTPWLEPRTIWRYADPRRPHDEFEAKDATDQVVNFIRNSFLKFQKDHGNLRIIEKTPRNILKIPYVNAIFPESKFLYVVRNPFSCISSSEEFWQRSISRSGMKRRLKYTPKKHLPYYFALFVKEQLPKIIFRRKYLPIWGPRYRGIDQDLLRLDRLSLIARQWAICSRKAEEDLAALPADRVLKLKYEEFVAAPEEVLTAICAHCGLEVTTEMIEMAKEIIDPNRQQKWERFDRDTLRSLVTELEAEMERQDYQVPPQLL